MMLSSLVTDPVITAMCKRHADRFLHLRSLCNSDSYL
jgi:hypothetical protein